MGIIVGIANALTVSLQNTIFRNLSAASPFVLNWFRFVVAIPILAILVSVFSGWLTPPPIVWVTLLGINLPFELLQSYFYVSAYQRSPQSLVGPLFSLSGIFLVPLGYFVLGEAPSPLGILGVVSVVIGPFLLGWERQGGFPKALANVFRESGSWRMLLAAFFSSVVVVFSKFAYAYVPPLIFAFYITAALLAAISVILLFRRVSPRTNATPPVFGMSAIYGVSVALHYIGLSLLLAAYFISVKRLSIVFDVLLGRAVHGEDHFRARFAGALLMVAGVILIALG